MTVPLVSARSRTVDGVVLALLGVATTAIAVSQMRNGDLWFDETFSVSESLLPLREMWPTVLREGANMWGYIFLLRPLQMLPASEAVYEAPSVLFGIAAVLLHYRTLRVWCSRSVALLFGLAFLAALANSQLTEVRSYAAVVLIGEVLLLYVLDPRRIGAVRGLPACALLLVAPLFHLLLVFPVGVVLLLLLATHGDDERALVVRCFAAAGVGVAFVGYVNLRNPLGSGQLAWLTKADLGKTVDNLERVLAFALPSRGLRGYPGTLAIGAAFVAIGLTAGRSATTRGPILAQLRSRSGIRLALYAIALLSTYSVAGMVTNAFLTLPDRYGLLVLPPVSLALATATDRGVRALREIGGGRTFVWAAGLLALLLTLLRLDGLVGFQEVRNDQHYSARGSAIHDLIVTDMATADGPRTVYVISPGARLEYAVWRRLHQTHKGVPFVDAHLRPFTVTTLAHDSVNMTKQWLGVATSRPGVVRVAVIDYAEGCHRPIVGELANAVGADPTAVQARQVAGYSLSVFPLTGQITKEALVQRGNCALAILPADGDSTRWG